MTSERRARPPTLFELLGEDSPIARCEEELLELLETWAPGSEAWAVLEAVAGADAFNNREYQDFARSFVLQLIGSMCDHFSMRLAGPPHSAAVMFHSSASEAEIDETLQELFDCPRHCLMSIGRLFRALYPAVQTLKWPVRHQFDRGWKANRTKLA